MDNPILTAELQEVWPFLSSDERADGFKLLERSEAVEFFLELPTRDQAELIEGMTPLERMTWIRVLAPDDAADVIQEFPEEDRPGILGLLDAPTRAEVSALLAYAEDDAGGLMSTRYARVRPNMSVEQAMVYLRRQAGTTIETIYYAYVLDAAQRLQGVVSFRELFSAAPTALVKDVMETDLVKVQEDTDQESISHLFAQYDLLAIPVVDGDGHMKGIVTVDDVVDVVQEEATEDIHKFGGLEALDEPYLEAGMLHVLKKRGGWLSVLFLGEMLTATAMGYYEDEISRAVVLSLFIPLIISSGGNSGSQASTLVIRAMALGEVRLRDWWRVFLRELAGGIGLGAILGALGLVRIALWPTRAQVFGEHYLMIGFAIAISLVGVVLWGTMTGSMLPFILRRLGLDPASASAPLVATLSDVMGVVVYFSTAKWLLSGLLL